MPHRRAMLPPLFVCVLLAGLADAAERSGTVDFQIAVNAPESGRQVKLWFPYPTSDLD